MNEIIIIGAGPMGLYGAFLAGMRNLNGLVLESSYTYGGQISALYGEKDIYDVPGFYKIKGTEFIESLYKQYLRYHEAIPIKFNTVVKEIVQVKDYFIIKTNQGPYYSKKVLITNGGGMFSPKKLTTKGLQEQSNLKYHIENIDNYRDKRIAILGGGDSAADWSRQLSEYAKEVYLIHRRDNFRAHQGVVLEFSKKSNAKVLTPYKITKVHGDKLINQITLTHLKTEEELKLDIDYLIVFYGLENNKSNLDDFNVENDESGILVDIKMQTTTPGIFSAGNGSSYEGKLNMIVTGMGEVATAIGQIAHELYPNRNTNTIYSSMLVKE